MPTRTITTIQEHISFIADFYDQQMNGQPNFNRWMLENCRTFEPKERPSGWRLGQLGNCFQNAFEIVTDRWPRSNRYVYCEGLAWTGKFIPVDHAWVVDTEDDKAIDITWRHSQRKNAQYFGLTFQTEYVVTTVTKRGFYGDVLINYFVETLNGTS
jgi:hypothetical protein